MSVAPKIDIHTHILPPHLPKWKASFGYGGFVELQHHKSCSARMVRDDGTFFREVQSNCWDPIQRLTDCDKHGITQQVISTVPVMFSYWAQAKDGADVARFLNDHIAEVVAKHPTRFIGLGTLPLQDPELAIAELTRCMQVLGLAGVQIGSHVNNWNLSDPALFPVWQAAERLGASVFVHPWDMMGQESMSKYWLPWLVGMPAEVSRAICSMIFGGVFARLPKLRVAFAHGGGAFPITLGRVQHGFEARPDLCAVDNTISPKDTVGKFWVDALVHSPSALAYIIDVFGADKVALGSDYPFPLGEDVPGTLIDGLGLDSTVKQKLLCKNALAWLGRSAP